MSGGSGGYDYYVWLSEVRYKTPEQHDKSRALPLGKESNGYCPICGYWSIRTNVENIENGEKSDYCNICGTLFDASGVIFIDSQKCICGHPKDYHGKMALSCIKGKESLNCQCEEYRPTEVIIKESLR
jgi:hypothetical protein